VKILAKLTSARFWGFHCHEDSCPCLLGCDNMYRCIRIPTIRIALLHVSSQ